MVWCYNRVINFRFTCGSLTPFIYFKKEKKNSLFKKRKKKQKIEMKVQRKYFIIYISLHFFLLFELVNSEIVFTMHADIC